MYEVEKRVYIFAPSKREIDPGKSWEDFEIVWGVLKKNFEKNQKRFGENKKVITFALPFNERGCFLRGKRKK